MRLSNFFVAVGLLVALSLLATSCGNDGADTPVDNSATADYEMLMILSVGDATEQGRAPSQPEGGYDPGEGYENYIDVANTDFRFWFVDDENRYIGALKVNGVIALESPASSKYYHVLGRVERDGNFDPSKQNFKVLVLANWGTYPEPEAGTHIDEIVASAEAGFEFPATGDFPSAENLIPLYGIQEFKAQAFNENHFASLGRIHLLRSYAKVEVVNSAESALPLKSVTLTRYNTTGRKAPEKVYCRADYVKDNWADDYTAAPTLPVDVVSRRNLPLKPVDDGSRYIVYVPEYRNSAEGDTRAELTVEFEGYPYPSTVEFKDYVKEDTEVPVYYNIMRNWWYRFTVTKIKGWADLEVEVDVQPYGSVVLNPDFGLDRDENGNLIIP